LYLDVLGRQATSDEVSFWSGALAGGTTRISLAKAVVSSREAGQRVINSVYSVFFARLPGADESSFYLTEHLGGAPVVNVAPGFLVGTENVNNAQKTVVSS